MGPTLVPTAGTSASAPLLAGMIALWNDMRFQNGMPPLGFMNPLLYEMYLAHPEAFNDIVTGNNKCLVHGLACCNYGFTAAVGWDAVSGLGSPNFAVLSRLLMNPNDPIYYTLPHGDGKSGSNYRSETIAALVLSVFACVASMFLGYRMLRLSKQLHQIGNTNDNEQSNYRPPTRLN